MVKKERHDARIGDSAILFTATSDKYLVIRTKVNCVNWMDSPARCIGTSDLYRMVLRRKENNVAGVPWNDRLKRGTEKARELVYVRRPRTWLTAVLRARFLSLLSCWHCLGTACEFTWSPLRYEPRYIKYRRTSCSSLPSFALVTGSTLKERKRKKKKEKYRKTFAFNRTGRDIVFPEFVGRSVHESTRTFPPDWKVCRMTITVTNKAGRSGDSGNFAICPPIIVLRVTESATRLYFCWPWAQSFTRPD